MIRAISSPSSSTTGLATLIFAIHPISKLGHPIYRPRPIMAARIEAVDPLDKPTEIGHWRTVPPPPGNLCTARSWDDEKAKNAGM
jgi:hypothetical protein